MRDIDRHQCPIGGCPELLPLSKLMDAAHWRMVPPHLQQAVYAAYANGAGVGTPELADAQQAAIGAVEAKLAAKGGTR